MVWIKRILLFLTFRLKEYLSVSFSAAAGLVSPMKALDGRDVSLMPPDRFLLGGPLILRGFAPKSIEYSESNRLKNIPDKKLGKTDACYLGGKAFWRACAQLYFPMPYLRRKNTWVADNMKGMYRNNLTFTIINCYFFKPS
jgi:outer membrane protein assembly factor BamA